ncbi:MAG: hypothetical protein SFV17_18685 [Candidatus Obscuribacter sp.]|nr:hypothetical protein [Candidatus Obscuribacter sp.]
MTKKKPWPLPYEYAEALQTPEISLKGELRGGIPFLKKDGTPLSFGGAFASVYKVKYEDSNYAIKCFLSEIDDRKERYLQISKYFKHVNLPNFVPFLYVEDALLVGGVSYPALKMRWVEGQNLVEYVREITRSNAPIDNLIVQWLNLVAHLRELRISHCDLQHENILIENQQLRLIDYDGAYVPALEGLRSHENGHQNYQHPLRTDAHFGTYVDNFSAWCIYTSLYALAADPLLRVAYATTQDSLIFVKEDLADAQNSVTFQKLKQHANLNVRALAAYLEKLLKTDLADIPYLNQEAIDQVLKDHKQTQMKKRAKISPIAVTIGGVAALSILGTLCFSQKPQKDNSDPGGSLKPSGKTDISKYAGSGLGTGLGPGLGTGSGFGTGLGTGLSTGSGFGTGLGTGLSTGSGFGTGLGAGLGTGSGLGTGLGAGLSTGSGLGTGSGTGLGSSSRLGIGWRAGLGTGSGLGTGLGAGLGTKFSTDGNTSSQENDFARSTLNKQRMQILIQSMNQNCQIMDQCNKAIIQLFEELGYTKENLIQMDAKLSYYGQSASPALVNTCQVEQQRYEYLNSEISRNMEEYNRTRNSYEADLAEYNKLASLEGMESKQLNCPRTIRLPKTP